MNNRSLFNFVFAAALAGIAAPAAYAGAAPTPPRLQDVLAVRGGKVIVFQPTQIKMGQQIAVTHTQFSRPAAPRGFQRATQFVVYSSEPNPEGEYPVLYSTTDYPAGATGAAPGGGPHVKVLDGYTHSSERRGIIAVLIGLLVSANDAGVGRMTALPAQDAFSLELNDGGGGIPLLLPAVQKVREAAAR